MELTMRQFIDLLNFFGEYGVVLLFFSPLKRRQVRWHWLGYLCLAAVGLLYFPATRFLATGAPPASLGYLATLVLRLLFYWAAVSAYLLFHKDVNIPSALYLAAFYTSFYNAARILGSMVNYAVENISVLLPLAEFHRLWMSLCILALEFTAAVVVHRAINLTKIVSVGRVRYVVVVISNFLMIYFKHSVEALRISPAFTNRLFDLFLYPICAIICLLALLILFESLQASLNRRRELEVEQVIRRYELKSAQRAIETSGDLRRVYHDMKNHLLAIRTMDQHNQQVSAYVDSLLTDLSGYDSQVSTGLALMDSFLSEKLQRAAKDQVQCNITLALSALDFMAPADLIAIFGNAFDNALEAVRAIPDPEERVIILKSSRFANTLLLRFVNPYIGTIPKRREGFFATRKAEPQFHGIGLRSITRAAQRYGGIVEPEADEERHVFSLTLLLPLSPSDV